MKTIIFIFTDALKKTWSKSLSKNHFLLITSQRSTCKIIISYYLIFRFFVKTLIKQYKKLCNTREKLSLISTSKLFFFQQTGIKNSLLYAWNKWKNILKSCKLFLHGTRTYWDRRTTNEEQLWTDNNLILFPNCIL